MLYKLFYKYQKHNFHAKRNTSGAFRFYDGHISHGRNDKAGCKKHNIVKKKVPSPRLELGFAGSQPTALTPVLTRQIKEVRVLYQYI